MKTGSDRSQNLKKLSLLSCQMGKDSRIIQATGGNTSLKENGILWVKASGTNLANALEQDIFIPLDLAHALDQMQRLDSDDELSFLTLDRDDLRPSIETSLHALMPHRVVLHSHPIDVITLSLMPRSRKDLKDILEDIDWHWIPYCRPGKPLAKAISTALDYKHADVLILANHGLVVGGSSPEEASTLQAEVTKRLFQLPRSYPEANEFELSKWLYRVPRARLPHASVIHSLATDPFSLELAKRTPPYPDHVVFCGINPWVITTNCLPPKPDIAYGLIPGVGVILLESASAATEAMLQAQAEVYLRIPPGRDVNLLSQSQCLELLNWDAEKYRQAIGKEA